MQPQAIHKHGQPEGLHKIKHGVVDTHVQMPCENADEENKCHP